VLLKRVKNLAFQIATSNTQMIAARAEVLVCGATKAAAPSYCEAATAAATFDQAC